jgi:hypothetical protein
MATTSDDVFRDEPLDGFEVGMTKLVWHGTLAGAWLRRCLGLKHLCELLQKIISIVRVLDRELAFAFGGIQVEKHLTLIAVFGKEDLECNPIPLRFV